MTLSHGAEGWSVVCDCGISWSYSLFTKVEMFRIPVRNYLSGFLCLWLCINKNRIWGKNLASKKHLSHLLAEAVAHSRNDSVVACSMFVYPFVFVQSVCILFLVQLYFLWRKELVILTLLCFVSCLWSLCSNFCWGYCEMCLEQVRRTTRKCTTWYLRYCLGVLHVTMTSLHVIQNNNTFFSTQTSENHPGEPHV